MLNICIWYNIGICLISFSYTVYYINTTTDWALLTELS